MIELKNVSRSFQSFKAVDNVSFSIKTGEIVGFLGPNGAGKTTTMRMITSYLSSDEGQILIDEKDISLDEKNAKKKIGYMSESAPLYGDMIVHDYLEYIAKIHGENPNVKVPQLCEACGLKDVMHKNISDLSRGYKQRVGLAHALMSDPEILILDEPTSGLDPNQIIQVRNLIKEIGKTRTVIISTHILGEVEMLCDRVIIISNGKIVADSPTSELRSRYANSTSVVVQVAGCSQAELEKAVSSIDGIDSVVSLVSVSEELSIQDSVKEKAGVLASVIGNKEVRPSIANLIADKGWDMYELSIRQNSLEDVFRTLTIGGSDEN